MSEDASADNTASTAIQETNRKLIKTVNMTVETEDYDGLLNTLDKKIAELAAIQSISAHREMEAIVMEV